MRDDLKQVAASVHGLIVDIDNTLINTQRRDYHSFLDTATEMGHGFLDFAVFREMRLSGASSRMIAQVAFPEMMTGTEGERFLRIRHRRLDRPELMRLDEPFPGVLQALETVRTLGIPVVAATLRSSSAHTSRELERLGLRRGIRSVIARDNVRRMADRPYRVDYDSLVYFKKLLLQASVSELKLAPSQVLFVTDTAFDLDAARLLGIARVGVRTGYAHDDQLLSLSDVVLDSFADVPGLLAGD